MLFASIDCKIKTKPTPFQHKRKCVEPITAHCTHVIIAGTPLLARAFEPTNHFRLNVSVCVLAFLQTVLYVCSHAHSNQPLCMCSALICVCAFLRWTFIIFHLTCEEFISIHGSVVLCVGEVLPIFWGPDISTNWIHIHLTNQPNVPMRKTA